MDIYGDGANEILLSKVLKKRRNEVFLCSKFGAVMSPNGEFKGISSTSEYVHQACENSLKRLYRSLLSTPLKDELQVKIPQNRYAPFNEQIDNSIKEFMKKFGQSSNPYVKVRKNINKLYSTNYTSKQIRQRWRNILNTDLCFEPLSEDEKSFIVQWAESKPQGDTIRWKELIPLMKTKFKKLRSENKVKNFWSIRKRIQEISKAKSETENSRKRKGSPNGDSNAILMDTSPKSEENIIHLPPLNARPLETSFISEEKIHLPPLNARPMETSFKSEVRIHLPPLNARPSMETSFKSEERIHLPPLNARPMEISFKNEVNTPPLNRMEILCWAADEAYKRDYPTK
ncbi:672_t:CDS:2 [Rhizophagus irregularis]|nr:672_t:CDS:2 [Rhizophagus irregularis]